MYSDVLTAESFVADVWSHLAPARAGGGTAVAAAWDGQTVIDWITTEFYIPEIVGKADPPAMPLADYQRAVLREAMRRDESGKFIYDLVLWSDIKKSAKSTIAAAVTLFRALNTPWGSFKIVANDLEQANSRVFYYLNRAVALNPAIKARVAAKQYRLSIEDMHSQIQAVPIDPSGEAGANDDFIEFTELHGAKSKAQVQMWAEMTIPPTKHGYAQRWIDTYAGFAGESPLLEDLYDRIVKQGQQLDLGEPGLEVYANGRQLALWNTIPRLPWQTPEYYASEAVTLPENQFNRIHRNQWGTSLATFVPYEWWTSCQREYTPCDAKTPEVFALDAAVSGDCFAILGVSRQQGLVHKRYCRIWIPPANGKIEYSNPHDPEDRAYPEGEIRYLAKTRNVIEWAYDPYQLHDLCTRLMRSGVGWFREFPQGEDRLKADKQLYDDIRDQHILHDGDPVLSEHIKNANAKTDPQDHTLRIVKRANSLKIDAAVALSMANHEARRLNIG